MARFIGKWQRSHGRDTAVNTWRHACEHRVSQVERVNRGGRIVFPQDAGEASLAAPDVGNALAIEHSQVGEHQLHVRDARIDGGRSKRQTGSRAEPATVPTEGSRPGVVSRWVLT